MANTVKISVRQFSIIVFMYTIGTTILIIPANLAADAKQDAWIASIMGVAINLLVVFLYSKIGSRFPGMRQRSCFILIVSVLSDFELEKLQPIFEADLKSLIKGAVSLSGTAALPYIALFMVFPAHIHNLGKTKRGFLAGTFLGGGFTRNPSYGDRAKVLRNRCERIPHWSDESSKVNESK